MNCCKVFVYSGLKCCGEEMVEVEFYDVFGMVWSWRRFGFLCNEPFEESLF